MPELTCPRCGQTLRDTEFPRDSSSPTGRYYLCKACKRRVEQEDAEERKRKQKPERRER